MTQEQKAKAYDKALEKATALYKAAELMSGCNVLLETIFLELKESEDERIRKDLLGYLHTLPNHFSHNGSLVTDWIAWLEKQAVQKPADKVEPKFKVGDWIIQKGLGIYRIVEVYESWYEVISYKDGIQYSIGFDKENDCYLWTIQDAKDGDVLSWDDSKCIAIFKNIYDKDSFNSYGFVGHCTGTFESRLSYHDIEGAHPATKEQRDTLEKAMADAGYTFDFEKKELKKIEN